MKSKESFFQFKKLFTDSFWSITALTIMNVVAQFIVYPAWLRYYNEEIYGSIVYCMSIINIFSVSFGTAANYARMRESSCRTTNNGEYNNFLLFCCVTGFFACILFIFVSKIEMNVCNTLFAGILCIATTWRFYADVEYRLTVNYVGYFKYYLCVSGGYLLGIVLFWFTGIWPLTLLIGEVFGLLYVFLCGKILKCKFAEKSNYYKENIRTMVVLSVSNITSNIIFNGDRLVLQNFLNGSAVTTYYLASLVGKTMSLITTPLNSVIIGHLSKYKGKITKKLSFLFIMITLIAIAIGTLGTLVGSYVLISIIYPNQILEVKKYFFIANLTQVIYFITNIITTVLLRFAKAECQVVINICYAVGFVIIGIPSVIFGGIEGFCMGLLIVNIIRYIISIGYWFKSYD